MFLSRCGNTFAFIMLEIGFREALRKTTFNQLTSYDLYLHIKLHMLFYEVSYLQIYAGVNSLRLFLGTTSNQLIPHAIGFSQNMLIPPPGKILPPNFYSSSLHQRFIPSLNNNFHVITHVITFIFFCSHCSCTFFILISYSLYT